MSEPLKLGVAGLGTVGAAVVRSIQHQAATLEARCQRPVRIVAVSARDKARDRGLQLSSIDWCDDPKTLATRPDIDVVVELIGGEGGAALETVEAALGAGRHVVTANKALLAHHGARLAELAEANNASLNFEAAVAGGIPIIKALRESLSGNRIDSLFGILNGTCNYILTRMEREGRDFDTILRDAQRLGYAEADPTFDIGGFDTAHKLAILTSLAFGTKIDAESVYVEGIENISPDDLQAADELGYRIKLLGVALRRDGGIEQRVHPTMVPKSSAIAQIDGVTNAISIHADLVKEVMLVGPGAGGEATASSVLSDIVDIARGVSINPLGLKSSDMKPYVRAPMRAHEGGYYIRLSVFDRPGAFAAIALRMAEQGISLESIMQKGTRGGPGHPPRSVILITHETMEEHIRTALDAIRADGHIDRDPQMIRIEQA